jgi:hypothetical protein
LAHITLAEVVVMRIIHLVQEVKVVLAEVGAGQAVVKKLLQAHLVPAVVEAVQKCNQELTQQVLAVQA